MTPSAIGPAVRSTSAPVPRKPGLPADLRRKAHARLAERIDPIRTRHKPLSLLRQDARRIVEQLLDAEVTISRDDRIRLTEDVIAESVWFGLFEELFREEDVLEILVLDPQQIQVRRSGGWSATAVRFRDADQLGSVLAWHVLVSEPVATAGEMTVGHHLIFPNGFRLLALAPPAKVSPGGMILYVRGSKSPSGVITPRSSSGTISVPARVVETAASGVESNPAPPAPVPENPTIGQDPLEDLFAGTRQRVTERIIASFAAAGLSDVNILPVADLRRVVLAYVVEFCDVEKLNYDSRSRERLALEILAKMRR